MNWNGFEVGDDGWVSQRKREIDSWGLEQLLWLDHTLNNRDREQGESQRRRECQV